MKLDQPINALYQVGGGVNENPTTNHKTPPNQEHIQPAEYTKIQYHNKKQTISHKFHQCRAVEMTAEAEEENEDRIEFNATLLN